MAAERSNSSLQNCQFGSEHGYGNEYFWESGILLAICGTFGLLGNISTITVLCRPNMRKSVFYNLLLMLACFDTLFLLTYGVSNAYRSLACPHNKAINDVFYPVCDLCLVGSIYSTVAISFERYLGICHPLLQFSRRARVFILPVVLISFAFSLPKFFEVRYSFMNGTLVTEYSHFRETNQVYKYGYGLWALVIFKIIIPLVALLFLNGSIIATVRGTMNIQRTKGRWDGNSTKILFWVIFVFLILHVPRVSFVFVYFLDHVEDAMDSKWHLVPPITRLSLTLNSSVNFIIYSMIGRKFRAEFAQVFQCKKATALTTNSGGSG